MVKAVKKKSVKGKAKTTEAAVQQAPAKKMDLKLITGIVLALLVVITAVEILSIVKINIRSAKKPAMLAHWKPGNGYTGLTSMYMYGDSLYAVDATRGTMMEYDVMTGNFIRKYSLAQGLYSMAKLSNGDVLALSAGNTLVRFLSGSDKPQAAVSIPGAVGAGFIAADSKDNLIVVDNPRNAVIKLDKDLKKILEFGPGELTGVKRAYIGPQDLVYVLDSAGKNKTMVKIFNEKGSVKKQFRVMAKWPASSYESLAITPSGNIYINNMTGNSVLCYGPNGGLLGSFQTTVEGGINISYPSGIAGGMDGRIAIPASEMLIVREIAY